MPFKPRQTLKTNHSDTIPMHKLQKNRLSRRNVIGRALWSIVYLLLFRPSPRPLHRWRVFLLRLFGAKITGKVRVYQSCRIWAPWNLVMHPGSCLGDHVDCYCVASVELHENAVVSQYSFLCTASHDYQQPSNDLMSASIVIGANAWITADVFIAPGVNIGEGAVITARSSVFSDMEPWMVASGNPARAVRPRGFQGPQT